MKPKDALLRFRLNNQEKTLLEKLAEQEGLAISEMGRRAVQKFLKDSTSNAAMPGHGYETDTVTRIETNLDDVSPQVLGAVMQQLLAAGALDVWFTPVQMKKSRPGTMLSALCDEGAVGKIADIIFTETTAFGLRVEKIARLKLTRKFETVKTVHGEVTVKLGFKGERLLQIAPEFESCRAIAERAGVPLREVQIAATEVARATLQAR